MSKMIHLDCTTFSSSVYAFIYDKVKGTTIPNLIVNNFYCKKCKVIFQLGKDVALPATLKNGGANQND